MNFVGVDYLLFDSQLSEQELLVRRTARRFADERAAPLIRDSFRDGRFPTELIAEMAELGFLGANLEGYGCAGMSNVEYGLIMQELERIDSGLRSFVSVQGALVMYPILAYGSDEQKSRWLPLLQAGKALGCFGLTEPDSGSDPASMKTFARRDGDDWVITGHKRWIGLGTIAHLAIVWAMTDEGVRGFIVPTDTPGFDVKLIGQKLSMRSSIQTELILTDVRLPADALLPNVTGLRGPVECLNEARYGIVWGVMGAARDSFEAALEYSKTRMPFDRPLAGFQLTQQKLVDMAVEINKGTLLALHLGRLKDAGKLKPHQISVGKLSNTREAITVAREARTILGGNGVTLEYSPMRHANNLDSVRTYEGTDVVHTLVIGHHLT
jgi:glutaryl-CoA dehydrogenase